MNEELKRMLTCPFCGSDRRMIVEGRKEGLFKCLRCDRNFVLPSTMEGTESKPNVLKRVMP